MDSPLVSVIMNCYNSSKYLRDAIESVYQQSYSNWEIIFWDNASTDNSADIARSYDERLKYFRGEKNIPLGAARNKAVEQATGSFIGFLDCDDIWLPTKLEEQILFFQRDPDVCLVYSDAIYFNAQGQEKRLFSKRKMLYSGHCFRNILVDYCLCMPTVMIRHSVLLEQPYYFNESFQVAEEADLFLRLAYRGKLAVSSVPLAKYRVHKESVSFQHPELFFIELALILNQFKTLLPDFDVSYQKEQNQLHQQQLRSKALYYLMRGEKYAARELLMPYLTSVYLFKIILLTFLPLKLVKHVKKWRTFLLPN